MESSGVDLSHFVHPKYISKNFICPITQSVLPFKGTVMTPCEHLFCEDALLEWLLRSSKCPVCNTVLDPESIRKPNRVIVNMLAELERFCPNRQRGCLWTGPNEAVEHHLASDCSHKKEEGLGFLKNLVEQLRIDNHALKEEAKKKDEEIHSLKIACSRNSGGEGNEYIMQQLEEKEQECAILRRKLQVLELSLAPHVPPNFFRPYDPDHGHSTSEGESDDNGGLSNTDNDGDVSSIGTVHRRRTISRHERHERHERHDRSSRRHKKSSSRESNDSDVRRIAGLKEAKEKLERGGGKKDSGGGGFAEENEKQEEDSDSDSDSEDHQREGRGITL